jgi:hypothetical protein
VHNDQQARNRPKEHADALESVNQKCRPPIGKLGGRWLAVKPTLPLSLLFRYTSLSAA